MPAEQASQQHLQQQQQDTSMNDIHVEPAGSKDILGDSKESAASAPAQDGNNNNINGNNGGNEEDESNNVIPANATQGGREINRKVLYVGNIDQHVTEDMLNDVFKVTGGVVSIKIFPDKNVSI